MMEQKVGRNNTAAVLTIVQISPNYRKQLFVPFYLFIQSNADTHAKVKERERYYKRTKRTAAGIPTWSPTVVLICRSTAYVWQSGRDAQFSADYGRTCLMRNLY
jgi:hypothetical protein